MDRCDVMILAGFAGFAVGLWLIHPAACLCVSGVAVALVGLWGARLKAARLGGTQR